MRIDRIKGLYLKYKDVSQPVENLDRQVYVFNQKSDRTCLVCNLKHIEILLQTGRYFVVGVEIEDEVQRSEVKIIVPVNITTPTSTVVAEEVVKPRKRMGRPKGSNNKRRS